MLQENVDHLQTSGGKFHSLSPGVAPSLSFPWRQDFIPHMTSHMTSPTRNDVTVPSSWPSPGLLLPAPGLTSRDLIPRSCEVTAARSEVTCECLECTQAELMGPSTTQAGRNVHSCHVPGCGKVYTKTSHLKAHLRSVFDDIFSSFSMFQKNDFYVFFEI